MLYHIRLFPEITIKTRPVRQRMIRQLRKNIRKLLRPIDGDITVSGTWDAITVASDGPQEPLLARLRRIPGIAAIAAVERHPLPDRAGMLELTLARYREALAGKTFAVRCKRLGRHPFKSPEIERFIGAGLLRDTAAAGVDLGKPQVTVALEIRQDDFYLIQRQVPGLGGFPLGSQAGVLSLLSGGFDSAVSSYLCTRRGLLTHYCFFDLGGREHERAVKEVARHLWLRYHASHRVKFVTVPFAGVVEEILRTTDNAYMGVLLKRMMLRAADRVARRLQLRALVTGESVAQVSSQTLENLARIDEVSDTLVLRPLATWDKQAIIDTARRIGTERFSRGVPEYCAVISRKPTTKARADRIARAEGQFDFAVFEAAMAKVREQLVTETGESAASESRELPTVSVPAADDIVIDIRHPDDCDAKPLTLPAGGAGVSVIQVPFYSLSAAFSQLDRRRRHLLYCERGVMSRLHGAHLADEGYTNIGILDPATGAGQPAPAADSGD